ncbi:hypothetical protein [Lactiplantibacillus mudanjiangensis]|uniref:Uncharacterized protein n=1 Tax=Lactiplantibacillus mudanjiangensis TaxID=1296538 RepID=A0A660EB10_9LACO|nr:hypothetical protein [Lactiplantibacillus mudanjiangensis]VDG25208.1 hypothetical protein [Lactobacillus sp. CBA3605] [Lactiplantibacillus mudanjiangensis]VDG30397.1 hypothetical protein [Lactobacillus sp. CBA3605] [Lactiplantibacillus mudanjiangensis]
MQDRILAMILSCILAMVIMYFIVVTIILTFFRSSHITVGRLHFKARLSVRKQYIWEPVKNDEKIRKAFIGYTIIGILVVLTTVGQFYVMAYGYPIETAVIACFIYILAWWSSRAAYMQRKYWEEHASANKEFTLASKDVFKVRMALFKSALVAEMVMSLTYMIYMLNYGVYY